MRRKQRIAAMSAPAIAEVKQAVIASTDWEAVNFVLIFSFTIGGTIIQVVVKYLNFNPTSLTYQRLSIYGSHPCVGAIMLPYTAKFAR
jgi:hypothetical protein